MSVVTCEFLGRLGNIMMQTATCIAYAKTHNKQWAIPANYHHRGIYRFWPKLPKYKGNTRKLKTYDVATDEGWAYAPIPYFEGDIKLRGFFQSELYFKHAEKEVREAFPLRIEPSDYVSIHVRRGDYLEHSGDFPPIDMIYITTAIEYMLHQGHDKFMVLSDDIPWCVQNFRIGTDYDLKFIERGNEFDDLSAMASCQHHIIANSTFSWMGAWLGHNPDKIVVSPSHLPGNWFGHNRVDTKDLLPPSWHQIKFR